MEEHNFSLKKANQTYFKKTWASRINAPPVFLNAEPSDKGSPEGTEAIDGDDNYGAFREDSVSSIEDLLI